MHIHITMPRLPEENGVEFRYARGWFGYAVDSLGRVWSCWIWGRPYVGSNWRVLKDAPHRDGYRKIGLCRDGKQQTRAVHIVVLEAFVGDCPAGMESRHFPDNNRANNCIENLAWGTHEQNCADKAACGTDGIGERHPMAKITATDVLAMRKRRKRTGESYSKIGQRFGLSWSATRAAIVGDNWKHIA